jgi:CDP-diacylglycerol--glycerol-3-phosphate 3-phosphatidyltransferase
MTTQADQMTPFPQLRLRWALTALGAILLLLFGYAVLGAAWQAGSASQWAFQTSLGFIYLLWVLGRNLSANHRIGDTQLLPTLGAANSMTLARGMLIACLLGFLFQPRPESWLAWIPGALYTLAVLADFLDGYLARLTRRSTRLGEILDMSFDGWGVLAASLLAIQYGQVPLWYLLVALARYIFLTGLWLRQRLHLPIYELQPSVRRRAFAGVQMGFLFFILMPVFSPPGTHLAAAIFALPFLAGFIVDWLAVCGVFTSRRNQRLAMHHLSSSLKDLVLKWLPVGLRLVAVSLLTLELVRLFLNPTVSHYPRFSNGSTDSLFLALAQVLVLLFLFLGVGGRVAAIFGLCILGIQQMVGSLTPTQIALAILYTSILYLGTGLLSLWKPEERLIYRRAGERAS